ncbi:hypothetical protein CC1G_04780 [Coprinopsis cinerea okayama7|uniref:SET domain-containing protein n=1 Tax=Coprinopsis cinerea (strain Okayama-7 / 130 / ATCC MYA-4618 / FGSC 9003) TaxID=240176 RepID=A8P2J4_COPC7|nr:hypothetical protein CC1G_04780 [Coprinopsis cinerea okayama7\|eukprot:XP_001838336.2 hypothetical protein CC1G_04780 [Coprinopsis cinerea okayama7\
MSDFRTLKSSRATRQSFVKAEKKPENETGIQSEISQKVESEPQLGSSYTPADGLYSSLPSSLQIRVEPETGRGIYTTDNGFKPGAVLVSTKPHIATLSTSQLSSYCSACFGPGTSAPLKRCPNCKIVMYCGSACQSRDWSLHKLECSALQRWMSQPRPQPPPGSSSEPQVVSSGETRAPPSDAIRTLARILWRKQKVGLTSTWAKEIDLLQSHRASLSKPTVSQSPTSNDASSNITKAAELHTHLSHGLIHYMGLTSPQELEPYGINSAGDLVDLLSRFTTNTFTLTSPSLTPLGACISPVAALFNHSCDPNAVIVFPRPLGDKKEHEPLLQIIAIKPIPPNTQASQEGLEKAERIQGSDPQKALHLTRNLVPLLTSAGLVPSAHPLLALTGLHTQFLIDELSPILASLPSLNTSPRDINDKMDVDVEEVVSPNVQREQQARKDETTEKLQAAQEALDSCIRFSSMALTGLSEILSYGHPVRGVAAVELGKLLVVDEPWPTPSAASTSSSPSPSPPPAISPAPSSSFPPSGPPRLKLAHSTLVNALNELKIGFGTDINGESIGELGKEVRKMLVDVEKELSVWEDGVKRALEDARLAQKGAQQK